ncbi:MAG: hypothetical protein H6624_07250 [Bdellovibrionaceae bacterium]|nr:hypothetical protein [Bdellovibrionales bacterium]MCB9084124.1 hypothetical protein [Pseudobdellovibrionaceae bacterium]
MSREETKRYPLRNCIRPDTYRYCLDGEVFPEAWEKLAKQFGRIRRFGELDLYEINGMSFLLRASYGTSSITVIKKNGLVEEDLQLFHATIGFVESGELAS